MSIEKIKYLSEKKQVSENTSLMMTGGEALVQALLRCGVRTVYGIPGETTTPLQMALQKAENIRFILGTHEGESAFSAYAEARISGLPSILMTTGSPGLSNARIAIESSYKASRPMIILVGQVETRLHKFSQDASQYVDIDSYKTISKRIIRPRSPQQIFDAFFVAHKESKEGRPGPVIIELPLDILAQKGNVLIPENIRISKNSTDKKNIDDAFSQIMGARKIAILAGEIVHGESCYELLKQFSELLHAPVITPLREQDVFDNSHANYAGCLGFSCPLHLKKMLNSLRDENGTMVVVGSRLPQEATGDYSAERFSGINIVHLYPDFSAIASALIDLYPSRIMVDGSVKKSLMQLNLRINETDFSPRYEQKKWCAELHAEQIAFQEQKKDEVVGKINREEIYLFLKRTLPKDTIIVTGSGNHTSWPREMWSHNSYNTQVGPIDGAMGLGVPGAIGAAIASPARIAVAIVGDGEFDMNGFHAMKTASAENIPLLVIIDNNNSLGNVGLNQHRAGMQSSYKVKRAGRAELDYRAIVEGFGGKCWNINYTAEFESAFTSAMQHYKNNGIAVINLRTDARDVLRGHAPLPKSFVERRSAVDESFLSTNPVFTSSARKGFSYARELREEEFRKYINFRGGDPMLPAFKPMIEAASAGCSDYLVNTYESQLFSSETKEVLAHYADSLGITATPENIAMAPGVSALFNLSIQALIEQNILRADDVILIPTPTYGIFSEALRALKLEVNMHQIVLSPHEDYLLTARNIDEKISEINSSLRASFSAKNRCDIGDSRCDSAPRVKIFLMINPHNPLGTVYTRDQITSIAAVLDKQDVWEIDDLAYRGLEYDNNARAFPFAAVGKMSDKSVTFLGLSKPFAGVQLRGGFAVGPATVIRKMRDINYSKQGTEGVPIEAHHALRAAYSLDEDVALEREKYLCSRAKIYQHHGFVMRALLSGEHSIPESERKEVRESLESIVGDKKKCDVMLRGIAGVSVLTKPKAGFYHVVDFSYYEKLFSEEKHRAAGGKKMIEYFVEKEKILLLPGYSMLWPDKNSFVCRMSFSLPLEKIVEGVDRIKSGLQKAQEECFSRDKPGIRSLL
jgi:acetolactate synthase-1/2/3 large subunit